MSDISTWSNTAASNNTAPPDGAPEGMNPSDVNNVVREVMAALRRQHEDAQWINLGHAPTFATSTTFTVAGDLTGTYDVGRRIRCTDATTLYGEITASSYSAPDTTVTVSLDSGSLSAGLTAVAIGILSGTNQSIVTPGTRLDGAGIAVIRGDLNAAADDRLLRWQFADGTNRAEAGNNGNDSLVFRNLVNSGWAAVQTTQSDGTLVNVIVGDPDAYSSGYNAGLEVWRTATAALGGLLANNTLTGAGFERVLTVSDLPATPAPTLSASKTSLETVTSSTTLQNDDNLFISSIPATTLYKLDMQFQWSEGGGDIQFDMTTTGTLSNSFATYEDFDQTGSASTKGPLSFNGAAVSLVDVGVGNNTVNITGYVLFTTSNNTLRLRWAQNTSNAAGTSIPFGYMTLTPV